MTLIGNPNSELLQKITPDNKNTSAARDTELANMTEWEDKNKKSWNNIIDKLLEWWKDPEQLVWDDAFIVPSREIIEWALQIARRGIDVRELPPDRVAPDGEGGITFETYNGAKHESFTINPDLTVEILRFDDCSLIYRKTRKLFI